jgi:glutathione S-transferase
MITISAFRWVPPFARGQVRDLRVRWALEEAGLSYTTRLLEQGDQDKPEYRALQPFGQVPIFEEDGQVLFETGAIVLHIGERSEALLPKDAGARARAVQWLIAALNSVEPHVMNVAVLDLFHADQEWARAAPPGRARLRPASHALAGRGPRRQGLPRRRSVHRRGPDDVDRAAHHAGPPPRPAPWRLCRALHRPARFPEGAGRPAG